MRSKLRAFGLALVVAAGVGLVGLGGLTFASGTGTLGTTVTSTATSGGFYNPSTGSSVTSLTIDVNQETPAVFYDNSSNSTYSITSYVTLSTASGYPYKASDFALACAGSAPSFTDGQTYAAQTGETCSGTYLSETASSTSAITVASGVPQADPYTELKFTENGANYLGSYAGTTFTVVGS